MTAQLAWLVDTNVVSEMMRPQPAPQVATFLDAVEREGLGIASVTVWEVLVSIAPNPREDRSALPRARHRDRLHAA